jgi:hypothetical protein
MSTDFHQFFKTATGHSTYGYQCRLARGEGASAEDDATATIGSECCSRLIEIPTGLDKTAAVVSSRWFAIKQWPTHEK